MKNFARIKKQIRLVYLLRGLLAGVIAAVVLSGIMMVAKLFIYNTLEVIVVDVAVIGFFTVLFFLFSFWKSNKVLKNIRRQDKEYKASGTVPFDEEHFAETGESRDFFLGEDWLLWHRDLNTKAWHRDELESVVRIGAKDPGNKVGMMRITDRTGKKEEFAYRLGETDAAVLIDSWLNPPVFEQYEENEEPAGSFCPQCGAPVNPGEAFCGTCGARLG